MGNSDSNPAGEAGATGSKDDSQLLDAVAHTNKEEEPEDLTLHRDAPVNFKNWNNIVSPPDDDEYRFRYQIARMESMVMYIKAAHTARISLARKAQLGKVNFEVVLGLGGNKKSTIQKQVLGEVSAKEVLASSDTPDILSADEYRPFWFNWANGQIKVGTGDKVGATELLKYEAKQPDEVLVLHVGVQAPKSVAGDFFITPDTFAATVVARSIKKLADSSSKEASKVEQRAGEQCDPSVAPYLANWFCFKPEKASPYKKHQDALKEKGPVVVGEDGSFSFCDTWTSMSVDEKNKFIRDTETENAKRMRLLYKAVTKKDTQPVA